MRDIWVFMSIWVILFALFMLTLTLLDRRLETIIDQIHISL